MGPMSQRELVFRELRLDGQRSIAKDVPDDGCQGIYAYEFKDGTWYVGKSIDVRSRHQQHLHDWRQETPPLVPARMLFAEVKGDETLLDRAETEAIAQFARGHELRNIMKTSLPGGEGT